MSVRRCGVLGRAWTWRLVLPLAAICTTAARAEDAPSAEAETSERRGLEEIVVTARKRTESLQNVPVAVEAFSQEQLKSNDATDLSKLAELSPQVIISPYSIGTGGILTIRGISSGASDAGVDQSVSVVLDGVALSRGRVISASLFDMQQVEVMKGPQALFFGKNSPAGVIALETADPTHRLSGYVTGGYEFKASERFVEAAVSFPIIDTLSARLAVRGDQMGGWLRNDSQPVDDPVHPGVTAPGALQGGSSPDGNDVAGRFTLLWEPSEQFDAKLKLTYDRQRLNNLDPYSETFCTGAKTVPTISGIPLPFSDCSKNQRISESANPAAFSANYPFGNFGKPYSDSKFTLASLSLNGKFDTFKVTSTTGYYQQSVSGALSADYSSFSEIYDTQHEHYNLVTEEVRASTDLSGPLNFMAGVYYEHSIRHWANFPDLFHAAENPATGNFATVETAASETGDSYSGFVQARWNIVPTVELAVGARFTHDVKDMTLVNLANNPVAVFLGLDFYPERVPLASRYDGNNASPELTLSWHPAPDQTLYGAYKTGYKSGGVSNGSLLLSNATAQNLQFGPEKTRGGEIGYKADLFNRRVRLDAVAYYYNYYGLQVTSLDPATISFSITNASAARTQGIELSSQWLATDSLSFHGSVGYNRARYLNFRGAQCYVGQTEETGCVGGVQDLSGRALNRAPNVMLNVGASYEVNLWSNWRLALSLDGAYSSAYQAEPDYAPGGEQAAFWRLNAGLHVLDDHWDVGMIGRNLTDTYYLLNSSGLPARPADEYVGAFARPREVIVQAQYHF